MSAKYYFYRMTTDNGGAPCLSNGVWSLAICKPQIRRTADVESIIIGFAGNDIDAENGIVHVARVTKKPPTGDYYKLPEYQGRADRIYHWDGSAWSFIEGSRFHSAQDLKRDIGEQGEDANVLLSDDFRYFGSKAAPYQVDWSAYTHLRLRLNGLRQGARVNHDSDVLVDLKRLVAELFKSTAQKVVGEPSHEEDCPCNRDDEDPVDDCVS